MAESSPSKDSKLKSLIVNDSTESSPAKDSKLKSVIGDDNTRSSPGKDSKLKSLIVDDNTESSPAKSSKLKSPIVNDNSSEEKKKSANDYDLGLSLDKLSLGPKKKLLVLCFGGLLVDRVHKREIRTVQVLRADAHYGNFSVFKRPFCTEFLRFCFQRFDVALWSSAREHNIGGVLDIITAGEGNKFVFVWGQSDCTDTGSHCLTKKEKPLFLKQLKRIWENKSFKGQYSAANTLLIDDEPHTSLLNPPNTAIFPIPYKKHDRHDTFLGPDGELRKFLDGLVDAKDVPSYVKKHPIGQAAINAEHPDWSYYKTVISKFGNFCGSDSDYD